MKKPIHIPLSMCKASLLALLLLILFSLGSCNIGKEMPPPTATPPMPGDSGKLEVPSTLVPTPWFATRIVTKQNSCILEKSILSGGMVYNYFWSRDGKEIYFTSDKAATKWFVYNIYARITRPAERNELELINLWLLAELPNSERMYYSPSVAYHIELKSIPENTTAPYSDRNVYQDVYLYSRAQGSLVKVGRVDGIVDNVFWVNDETRAILTMGQWLSPAQKSAYHVYIVDIKKEKLFPAFARNKSEEIDIKGISFDGNWLFYNHLGSSLLIHMRNLQTERDIELDILSDVQYIWDAEGKLFFVQPGGSKQEDRIMLYSFENNAKQELKHLPFQYNTFSSKGISLSPDLTRVLYFDKQDKKPYLLTICP